MLVGRFMILVDSTVVVVANPSIMASLHTTYHAVIWVTSAYLLAFAVPLLVAGRLGDRFGQKSLYVLGLAIFVGASAWCGFSGTVGMLIAARAVQGVGAALLAPQILSMVTRLFPPRRRGAAMSVWGVTAAIATLVGPLASGVLVDTLGWQWIFFVNVPIGVVALALAVRCIPALPTQRHRFDWVGVGLSTVGVFLIVFGLQQGQAAQWQSWIFAMIVAGVAIMSVFVYWQSINAREPLVPPRIFGDRGFIVSTIGVAAMSFTMTSMTLPVMFYAQAVCGLPPIRAALLTASMAIVSGGLAPVVGRIVDRSHPRHVIGFGFSVVAIGLTWLSVEMSPSTPVWRLTAPFLAMGIGVAFVWSPLAANATRNLPAHLAGASSGVYDATRQLGAVLGSAGMAALMTSRISAEVPVTSGSVPPVPGVGGAGLLLPELLREPFCAATAQSMWLPASVALLGVVAALFMVGIAAPAGRIGRHG
ncbi:MFS transporter [Mycobacterium camsae]|uniref:MFS transporter n=1 Tax=Mycobacterium gordonae TaxID=1778 RepID=UPI003D663A8B